MKTRLLHTAIFMALLFPAFYTIGQELKSSPTAKQPIQLGFQPNISRFIENARFPEDPGKWITGLGLDGVIKKQIGSRLHFYTGLGVEFSMVDELSISTLSPNTVNSTVNEFTRVIDRTDEIFVIEVPLLLDMLIMRGASLDLSFKGGLVFHWSRIRTRFNDSITRFPDEKNIAGWTDLFSPPDLRGGITLHRKIGGKVRSEWGIDIQGSPNFWKLAFSSISRGFNSNPRRVQLSARYTFYPQFGKK